MAFAYQPPSPEPPCCGTTSFNLGNRECQRCEHQGTCRQRLANGGSPSFAPAPLRQPSPTFMTAPPKAMNPYYPPPASFTPTSPNPYYTPPASLAPAPPVSPPMFRPQAPTNPAVPMGSPAPVQYDRYGHVQDPLYHLQPPPMRVQLPGETFLERAGKNMVLDVGESMLKSLLIALRQIQWFPAERPRDVTPQLPYSNR